MLFISYLFSNYQTACDRADLLPCVNYVPALSTFHLQRREVFVTLLLFFFFGSLSFCPRSVSPIFSLARTTENHSADYSAHYHNACTTRLTYNCTAHLRRTYFTYAASARAGASACEYDFPLLFSVSPARVYLPTAVVQVRYCARTPHSNCQQPAYAKARAPALILYSIIQGGWIHLSNFFLFF